MFPFQFLNEMAVADTVSTVGISEIVELYSKNI